MCWQLQDTVFLSKSAVIKIFHYAMQRRNVVSSPCLALLELSFTPWLLLLLQMSRSLVPLARNQMEDFTQRARKAVGETPATEVHSYNP